MAVDQGIKVTDIAYARMGAPDLDMMERFLTDFGLIRSDRTADKLYMRGTDPAHHIYIVEKTNPRLVGFAFHARTEADLMRAARLPQATAVEEMDEPGGGRRVRLTEPNGYQIEIVHGIERVPAIEVPTQSNNTATEPLRRKGVLFRLPEGHSRVKRIGHGVIGTPLMKETIGWFRENLGLICSDDVYAGEEDNLIASFNRCDRGDEYVDHHTLACVNFGGQVGLHHISFEVSDIEAVMSHHHYLKALNRYEHRWGVGRHLAGSQVFDYWADPWGRVHERWADSDRLNAASGSSLGPPEKALVSQWGEELPEAMARISP
jgi:catechol 2,3-dioxygenase-like lactoylglutathione lyase family enzyme